MHKKLTRTALLLAIALLFQSLRFFIPVPPAFSTLLIGSLVNGTLLLATLTVGLGSAVFIAVITPMVAYFQQLLPLPVFIIPVAFGNITLAALFKTGLRAGIPAGILLAACSKTIVLYGLFTFLLAFIALPPKAAAALMFAMSWPQLITGCIGGVLAVAVGKRLKAVLLR